MIITIYDLQNNKEYKHPHTHSFHSLSLSVSFIKTSNILTGARDTKSLRDNSGHPHTKAHTNKSTLIAHRHTHTGCPARTKRSERENQGQPAIGIEPIHSQIR